MTLSPVDTAGELFFTSILSYVAVTYAHGELVKKPESPAYSRIFLKKSILGNLMMFSIFTIM